MHPPSPLQKPAAEGGAAAGRGSQRAATAGGGTAGGLASTAAIAAAAPPPPLPRSLLLMRGVDTAVTLFSVLLQLSLALHWGGGLSGWQLAHQVALLALRGGALYYSAWLPARVWYRYR